MEVSNYTIPNVRHELQKNTNFPIYLDIDLTNAFHQFSLAEKTKDNLSIQTPWGQFVPNFMPEGIVPAAGVLQEVETFSRNYQTGLLSSSLPPQLVKCERVLFPSQLC